MNPSERDIQRTIQRSKRIEFFAIVKVIVLAAITVGVVAYLLPRPHAELKQGQTEISFWIPASEVVRMRDSIDAFERRFNGKYRVITGNTALRDISGDPQRFLCGVAGGVPPDAIMFDRFAIVQWAARGAWLPLDDLIEGDQRKLQAMKRDLAAAETAGNETKAAKLRADVADAEEFVIRRKDFYPPAWDEITYQRPGEDKPKTYGIPNSADVRALYYNEDLMIAAGFVDDDGKIIPPRTWEDMLTKRLDVRGTEIRGDQLLLPNADAAAADVTVGDQIAIDPAGTTVLARVTEVVDAHTLRIRSLGRPIRDGADRWIKIFDGSGYVIKLSQWDEDGRLQVCSFAPDSSVNPAFTNAYYYLFAFEAGGTFLSKDGNTCTMDAPPNVRALQWLVDVFDALGGYKAVKAFTTTAIAGEQDPFFFGRLAMRMDMNGMLTGIAYYNKNLRFGVVPGPMPADQLAPKSQGGAARKPVTWMGGWAYCIPSTADPAKREAAWELIKWMSSKRVAFQICDLERDIAVSQGRMYIPEFRPHIETNEALYETFVKNEPSIPQRYRDGFRVFMDLLPDSMYRPVTPIGNFLWHEHIRAFERAALHAQSPDSSLTAATRTVQTELNRVLAPPPGGPVNWWVFAFLYLALAVAAAIAIGLHYRLRNASRGYFRRQWVGGVVCASPFIIGFLVFTGGPIFFSIIMSLTDYEIINQAHWVGLANFKEAFTSELTLKSMGNTLFMAISVPLTLVLGLAIAMLLDTGVRALAAYRTVYYLPAIVPVVAASVLWLWIFHPNVGLVNRFLDASGLDHVIEITAGWFGASVDLPIKWLQDQDFAKPALIIMLLWGAGASMLIWLAGLKGVPQHLYEAAAIDGANAWRRFLNVTLPMISPYILFNLIIGIIQIFQIFAQAYVMTSGGPADATLFYAYHLFNQAFRYLRMGYASALAWILFVIIFVLTIINLRLSRKWVYYEV